jgi:methylmalonyl-CoA mutase
LTDAMSSTTTAAAPADTPEQPEIYRPKHKVRIVTAASLFDGHDAAINIMRRIIQATGCEVIHLGHDRSVEEVVHCAIQEDVQAIAMTSYQGGHNEYFKYMVDLLRENGAGHIKVFGGGGGVILPEEIAELHAYGVTRIYSPDDGRTMGLQGMINDLVRQSDFPLGQELNGEVGRLHGKEASPAPAVRARAPWWTNWSAAFCWTSRTSTWASSRWIPPSAKPAAPCSATGSA